MLAPEDFLQYEVHPRPDKLQPELQYMINNKILNHDKVEIYLNAFGYNLVEYENSMHKKLLFLIDQYMKSAT